MSVAVPFLHSLAQSLATIALYETGHPARDRAVRDSFTLLGGLRGEGAAPAFAFLGDSVVHDRTPLPSLRGWQWATRLCDAGVQRLEFTSELDRDGYERFLERLLERLGSVAAAADAAAMEEVAGVRFGAMREAAVPGAPDEAPAGAAAFALAEEVAVVRWIFANAERRGRIAATEAALVVRSLGVLRHADVRPVVPFLHLPAFGDYAVMHAINVASLALALAERMGASQREADRIALAGLLHDVGMVTVPRELLERNQLREGERERIQRHPVDGARLLLGGPPMLEAAAVAAYEHHLRPDGSGYPARTHRHRPHVVSAIVKVCSVFSALRSFRFHWPAWSLPRSLRYVEGGAGMEFEVDVALAFVRMLTDGRDRPLAVTEHADPIPDLVLLEAGDESATADRGTLS